MRRFTFSLSLLCALAASSAYASSYVGYSDTGFRHTSKRACCEDAILQAQRDSANACRRTGGFADYRPGTRVTTVVMTQVDDIDAWSAEEHAPLADYVVLTRKIEEQEGEGSGG